jgi:GNAT superfamily N-acetyltransferase
LTTSGPASENQRVKILSDEIRRLAEDPLANLPDPPPPARRIRTSSYCLEFTHSKAQAGVSALNTTLEGLDPMIAEVRGHLRAAEYTRCVWYVSPSSRPDGLTEALMARGFFPPTEPPYEPEMTAMALVEPPPPPPPGVEARRVRDYDEYLATMRIAIGMMGADEESSRGWLAVAPSLWADESGAARYTVAVYIDGKMVGFAWAHPQPSAVMLNGSTVIPEARGRGAYRALVAARWQMAVALGTPALAIQAGAMSAPVLKRCGFETICRIAVLEDPGLK